MTTLAQKRRYNVSPKGREAGWKYDQSPKGREASRRYDLSPKGRDAKWRYEQTPKGLVTARRRNRSEAATRARRKWREGNRDQENRCQRERRRLARVTPVENQAGRE